MKERERERGYIFMMYIKICNRLVPEYLNTSTTILKDAIV